MLQDVKPVTFPAAKQLLQDASEGLENLSILTESAKKTVSLYRTQARKATAAY